MQSSNYQYHCNRIFLMTRRLEKIQNQIEILFFLNSINTLNLQEENPSEDKKKKKMLKPWLVIAGTLCT
jgi:hypothetical protein